MTQLSVNINKIATLRNARGGDAPNLLQVALDCERFGAQGITVHPRPDQRHIKYSDVTELKENISTEFNIEGYPSTDFIELVLANAPAQVTLVPDPPEAITSNAGWDAIHHLDFLKKTVSTFKEAGIRVSIFMDPDLAQIDAAQKTGTDRIELYTEAYAIGFDSDKEKAIMPYVKAANHCSKIGLEVNAGHDLNQENLAYFVQNIPELKEVSIGHALICDALYLGLAKTIAAYLSAVQIK